MKLMYIKAIKPNMYPNEDNLSSEYRKYNYNNSIFISDKINIFATL